MSKIRCKDNKFTITIQIFSKKNSGNNVKKTPISNLYPFGEHNLLSAISDKHFMAVKCLSVFPDKSFMAVNGLSAFSDMSSLAVNGLSVFWLAPSLILYNTNAKSVLCGCYVYVM